MDAGNFDSPGGRAGVKEGLAKPLEDTREVDAGQSERREIGGAGEAAT